VIVSLQEPVEVFLDVGYARRFDPLFDLRSTPFITTSAIIPTAPIPPIAALKRSSDGSHSCTSPLPTISLRRTTDWLTKPQFFPVPCTSVERMHQSLNYLLVEEGLAYPTYYEGLFHDLRDALTEEAGRARKAERGIWAEDRTNEGFAVEGLASITDEHMILLKLFRRLTEYLEEGGLISGFKEWLKAREERILVLSIRNITHLDNVVNVDGDTVTMTELPRTWSSKDRVFFGLGQALASHAVAVAVQVVGVAPILFQNPLRLFLGREVVAVQRFVATTADPLRGDLLI
jgi:hypothetical protein